MGATSEQTLHDRVNLARLVRRLEKTVATETWSDEGTSTHSVPVWIRTKGALQKVKHARKLLQSVASDVEGPSDSKSQQRYDEYRKILDRLEKEVSEVDQRVAPQTPRPEPILPTIPVPSPARSVEVLPDTAAAEEQSSSSSSLLTAEEPIAVAAHELIPSSTLPDTFRRAPINPNATLLPPSLPSSTDEPGAKPAPAFLQNSAALQEELSAQLAQMATQLKRNATHFAGALDRDRAVVEQTQQKMEGNFDVMSKERVRLRDHHSKSWNTTWITLLSIAVVFVGFFFTFIVVRVT